MNYQPEKWEPYQVYLIARLTAWELNLGWWVDVVYYQLQKKLSQEKFVQLIPDYPSDAAVIISARTKLELKHSSQKILRDKKYNLSDDVVDLLNQFYSININARRFLGIPPSIFWK